MSEDDSPSAIANCAEEAKVTILPEICINWRTFGFLNGGSSRYLVFQNMFYLSISWKDQRTKK